MFLGAVLTTAPKERDQVIVDTGDKKMRHSHAVKRYSATQNALGGQVRRMGEPRFCCAEASHGM